MRNILIVISSVIVALIIGVFIGAKYLGKGEVMATICVLGNVAIEDQYLSEPEFLSLVENVGNRINSDYPFIASNIRLSDSSISRASEQSRCSQILVAISRGMQ